MDIQRAAESKKFRETAQRLAYSDSRLRAEKSTRFLEHLKMAGVVRNRCRLGTNSIGG